MATLREYFVKDGASNLTSHLECPITDANGAKLGELTARLHLDFDANAKYVSFYVPIMGDVECPEAFALNIVKDVLQWPETVIVEAGIGAEKKDARELAFTGQIYLYSERPVPQVDRSRFLVEAKKFGHQLTFRSVEYVEARDKWQTPVAFVSHDSRDKVSIAQPLALERLCSAMM